LEPQLQHHAGGAAALTFAANPGASPADIQTLLEQNTFNNHPKNNNDGTGRVDVSFIIQWYADCDGDTFFRSTAVLAATVTEADSLTPCTDGFAPNGGWSNTAGTDVDDEDASEFPGQVWYADCDGDGFFRSTAVISATEELAVTPCLDTFAPDGGWSHTAGTDVDDEDATEFPGQEWYADCDGDTFFRSTAVIAATEELANAATPCTDSLAPDGGWSHTAGTDVDDEDATEFPGQEWYADCDGDTFFRAAAVIAADLAGADALTPCLDFAAPDGGWSHTAGTDVDDEDATEFPGQEWYADCDGDGFFRAAAVIASDLAGVDALTPCLDTFAPDGGWSHTAGTDPDDEDASAVPGGGAVPCSLPVSGDWTITSSCTLSSNAVAPGNVIVQNNSVLTIPSGLTLDIDFVNNFLKIEFGSGVLIKAGGSLT